MYIIPNLHAKVSEVLQFGTLHWCLLKFNKTEVNVVLTLSKIKKKQNIWRIIKGMKVKFNGSYYLATAKRIKIWTLNSVDSFID